jgi:hypothetical protein
VRGRGFASRVAAGALAALSAVSLAGAAPGKEPLWPKPTPESRPWTRWWWLGSAVDEANLTRQLEQLAAAGFGGVEICPIYGAKGWEDRYVPFLSPRWMELLAHTTREAQRLSLAVDLTTGTGWPFGGPWVGDADASSSLLLKRDGRGGYTAEAKARVQQVKRAAPGGEGNVLDPYSVPALERYLARFDAAFAGFPGPAPRAHFHDSFEYYGASFTPTLWTEFEARRGYDLRTQLPALAGQGPDDTVARVRSDYRETLSDLHLEYVRRWTEWAHSRKGLSRNQAHGAPGDLLDLYAAADIPETEVFRQPDEARVPRLKLSSSAAHVAGRKLASAEAFTWLGEHFQVSLAQAKEAADWLMLSGVNHLVYHGIPYSPAGVPWPGWQFYASVNLGPEGGLWRDLPRLNAYVTRVQSVLQSGEPGEDVLLYESPRDVWHSAGELLLPNPVTPAFEETGLLLWRRGFAWDAVSERRLAEARVEAGRLCLGAGRYRALVVPRVRLMNPAAVERLAALAREGATVVLLGGPPVDVPGWNALESRRAALLEVLRSVGLGPGPAARRVAVGRGSVLVGDDVEGLLERAGVGREPMADAGVRFVRRSGPRGTDYFLVNRGGERVDGWVKLGTAARSAVLMDPRSADRAGVAALRGGAASEVYLQLEPGESTVLRTLASDPGTGDPWPYVEADGAPEPLDGPWRLEFVEGGPVLPAPSELRTLASWTALTDPEAQRFAGTGRYTLRFEGPTGPAEDWLLDLGKVAETARVTLNGRDVGTLWSQPFQLRVGEALRPGTNTLEIEVTNLAANRVRDLDRRGVAWKAFHDANVVGIDYEPLDASAWPLRDSGLLGPVALRRLLRVEPPRPTR